MQVNFVHQKCLYQIKDTLQHSQILTIEKKIQWLGWEIALYSAGKADQLRKVNRTTYRLPTIGDLQGREICCSLHCTGNNIYKIKDGASFC